MLHDEIENFNWELRHKLSVTKGLKITAVLKDSSRVSL